MQKAAQKPSQRMQVWCRAALLVSFVAEAIAFNCFTGAIPTDTFAALTVLGALLLLPFTISAFRRLRSICAFYAVFLLAFAGLTIIPSVAATKANQRLQALFARIQPGMKRVQVNKMLAGYERREYPSFVEWLRNEGFKDWNKIGCGNAYRSTSNFYAVTHPRFAHRKCAKVEYSEQGMVVSTYFYNVPDDWVAQKPDAATIQSAMIAVRRFVWLFTKDCSYVSSK